VGRAIAAERRGRFFALTQVLSGVARVGAGLLVSRALMAGEAQFSRVGGLLILACAVFFAVSYVFLVLIREPAPSAGSEAAANGGGARSLGEYVRALPSRLRARPAFARLALAQILASAVPAAAPFFLGFARARIEGLPTAVVGHFLIAQTVGGLVCAPLWGGLTDRRGPRTALLVLLGASLLSPAAAWLGVWGGSLAAFYAAFFVLGGVLEGGWAVFTNYLLESVPEPEQPLYIGLLSTAGAPSLLLPLGAGLLAAGAGPAAVLSAAALLLAAGLGVTFSLPSTRAPGAAH
jgi:Na+/melibiose symporter-like transporter